VSAVHEAFVSALSTGLSIGAGVTLAGAVIAWVLVSKSLPVAASVATAPAAGTPAALTSAGEENLAADAVPAGV
jgi:hypothetical protein